MHTSFVAIDRESVVITVDGDLDVASAPALKEQLFSCLDTGFRRLVVELSPGAVIDSTGLGVLVASVKHARGKEVLLVSSSPNLRRTLAVVGLNRVLPLFATRSDALSAADLRPDVLDAADELRRTSVPPASP